ncbi:MAG: hypothetical protein WBM44_07290 [Waterburya sp.]
MSINTNITNNSQDWNQEKLIELSENLGKAYNPGLNNERSNRKTDSWNADKFIKMSESLGEAFLPGLDNGKSSEESDSLTMSKFLEMNKNKDRSENKPDT